MAKSKKEFVVFHKASTMSKGVWKSEHGAKSAAAKLGAEYSWAEMSVYEKSVVYMVEKVNLMSGKKYMEASNAPGYMSPASEAYWAM